MDSDLIVNWVSSYKLYYYLSFKDGRLNAEINDIWFPCGTSPNVIPFIHNLNIVSDNYYENNYYIMAKINSTFTTRIQRGFIVFDTLKNLSIEKNIYRRENLSTNEAGQICKDDLPYTGLIYDSNLLVKCLNGQLTQTYYGLPIGEIIYKEDTEEYELKTFNEFTYIDGIAFALPGTEIKIPGIEFNEKYSVTNIITYRYKNEYLSIIGYLISLVLPNGIQLPDKYILNSINYLPNFLKGSPLMMSIMDCLNILISNEYPIFKEIKGGYYDMLYKVRDYAKLTDGAKIEIIKELGFDYVLDIIQLSSEQLTQLITFFNLIYVLKGKREGLELILDILGLVYEYVVWYDTSPKGQLFTAKLTITGNDYSELKVFKKIKNFIRSYMLPWIDITIETTIPHDKFYTYPIWGAMTRYKEETKNHQAISGIEYIKVGNKGPGTYIEGVDTFTLNQLQALVLNKFKN